MKDSMRSNCLPSLRILTILVAILWSGQCTLYTSIQWDPLNPKFKASQGYNKSTFQISVTMMSKVNVICPNVATNLVKLNHPRQKDSLYENLWMVDRNGFDSCKVNPSSMLLRKCDDPGHLKYKTLTLKPLSPNIGDPEFQHGKHYYFIATSNGSENSLDNRANGRCKTQNMKFQIYICSSQNDSKCKTVELEEPNGTSSTPTFKDDEKVEAKAEHRVACFISARDKTWLITVVGIVVGILLVLCLGCLAYTCIRRRDSKLPHYDNGDGNIPLNGEPENIGV